MPYLPTAGDGHAAHLWKTLMYLSVMAVLNSRADLCLSLDLLDVSTLTIKAAIARSLLLSSARSLAKYSK